MSDDPFTAESTLQRRVAGGDDRLAESLSALADGAATPAEIDQVLRAWNQDPTLRARWHRTHWIGDVMRSAELAHAPQRDLDLSAALRTALEREPTRLIPLPPKPARAAWGQALAAAAGLGAVALVVWVLAIDDAAQAPSLSASVMPVAPAPSLPQATSIAAAPAAAPPMAVGAVTRDEQLDRYLAVHRGAVLPVGWSAAALARSDTAPR